jgi:ABC-type lipoprotein release transport system permease subunit
MSKAVIDQVLEGVRKARIRPQKTVMRTVVSGSSGDAVVYFNGSAVSLMHVLGVDWKAEKAYFDSLNYKAVSPKGIDHDDTIVLSKPAADIIGAKPGDKVLFEIKNSHGQINTAYFTVSAIFQDMSIFGYYKVFLSKKTLNKLIGFQENECSVIGFYFANKDQVEAKREALYKTLKSMPMKVEVGKPPRSRAQYDRSLSIPGKRVMLITIPIYLTQVSDLLDSLNILTVFLYIMILLIIFVSAQVTYSLILNERAKDMGTMRALGFYESDVRRILFAEVSAAGVLAILAGFLLALAGTAIVARISFSGIPGFDMFLRDGKMIPLFKGGTEIFNIAAVYCALIFAIIPGTFRMSRTELPKLLGGGVKE